MSRRDLELQAKRLGIRGYTRMRMVDLQTRVEAMSVPPVISAEARTKLVADSMPVVVDSGPVVVKMTESISSPIAEEVPVTFFPITHECRHCKGTFAQTEMFMSKRVKEEHGIEVWFCRNTHACSARVESE